MCEELNKKDIYFSFIWFFTKWNLKLKQMILFFIIQALFKLIKMSKWKCTAKIWCNGQYKQVSQCSRVIKGPRFKLYMASDTEW